MNHKPSGCEGCIWLIVMAAIIYAIGWYIAGGMK